MFLNVHCWLKPASNDIFVTRKDNAKNKYNSSTLDRFGIYTIYSVWVVSDYST